MGKTSPLLAVVFRGEAAEIEGLLRAGADPDLANGSGVTARGLARSIASHDVPRFSDA